MSSKFVVAASLVLGADGSTSKNGSSSGLSSPNDRARFHKIRGESTAILIGGATARREPYKKTPIPLFIVTHSRVKLQPKNHLAKQLNMDPISALSEIENIFADKDNAQLLVEAGPRLLQVLLDDRKVDNLYLTINHQVHGENKIDIDKLLTGFKLVSKEIIESDEFCSYELAH